MKALVHGVAAALLIAGNIQAANATGAVRYTTIVIPMQTGPVAPPHNTGDPSLYLQCDGNPAHMSDAEKFARFMGAITLLGLFAPRPEVPEPAKRLFAEKGVEACSQLIDGTDAPKKMAPENFVPRRLPLILARAAHQIEAKNYSAALTDVQKARDEAKAAGLAGNPYFERSMGLSFNLMEASADVGLGDFEAARKAGLASLAFSRWSVLPLLTRRDFGANLRAGSSDEDASRDGSDKVFVTDAATHAARLEQLGRYEEASALREALITRAALIDSTTKLVWPLAAAAVDHAMASQWDKADERAEGARTALESADEAGKPDAARAPTLEYLDFYHVLKLAHEGRVDEARTLYAARTEWSSVFPGLRFNVADMLRKGARPDQLTGPLAKSGEQQFNDQRQLALAQMLQYNTNNQSLFSFILPYASVEDYEKLSDAVWNLKQERFIKSDPLPNSRFHAISGGLTYPSRETMFIAQDAMLLHAALAARAQGFKGLLYMTTRTVNESSLVSFANPGPDIPGQFYIDADAVIAELRQLIPSPDELAARRAKPASNAS